MGYEPNELPDCSTPHKYYSCPGPQRQVIFVMRYPFITQISEFKQRAFDAKVRGAEGEDDPCVSATERPSGAGPRVPPIQPPIQTSASARDCRRPWDLVNPYARMDAGDDPEPGFCAVTQVTSQNGKVLRN